MTQDERALEEAVAEALETNLYSQADCRPYPQHFVKHDGFFEIDGSFEALPLAKTAIAAHRKHSGWRPISSAPKDQVIWLGAEGNLRVGFWSGDQWSDWVKAECSGRRDLHFVPTHWQYTPTPPEAA